MEGPVSLPVPDCLEPARSGPGGDLQDVLRLGVMLHSFTIRNFQPFSLAQSSQPYICARSAHVPCAAQKNLLKVRSARGTSTRCSTHALNTTDACHAQDGGQSVGLDLRDAARLAARLTTPWGNGPSVPGAADLGGLLLPVAQRLLHATPWGGQHAGEVEIFVDGSHTSGPSGDTPLNFEPGWAMLVVVEGHPARLLDPLWALVRMACLRRIAVDSEGRKEPVANKRAH